MGFGFRSHIPVPSHTDGTHGRAATLRQPAHIAMLSPLMTMEPLVSSMSRMEFVSNVPGNETCHRTEASGFRVQGSGFRVQGSGFRVQGSGFRV